MDIFWKIVKNLNWDGDYERCAKELKQSYSKEDIAKLESTVNNLMSDLDTRFGHYAIPCGDDGWSDIRAEVIGRGKESFESITIEKLYLMANDTDYHESFMYIFSCDSMKGDKPSYPEHEKMKAVRDKSEIIGDFLEGCGYELCKMDERSEQFIPAYKSTEKILAEYFDIDLNKIEQEKLQMIEALKN